MTMNYVQFNARRPCLFLYWFELIFCIFFIKSVF